MGQASMGRGGLGLAAVGWGMSRQGGVGHGGMGWVMQGEGGVRWEGYAGVEWDGVAHAGVHIGGSCRGGWVQWVLVGWGGVTQLTGDIRGSPFSRHVAVWLFHSGCIHKINGAASVRIKQIQAGLGILLIFKKKKNQLGGSEISIITSFSLLPSAVKGKYSFLANLCWS